MVGVYKVKFLYTDSRNKFLNLKHFEKTWFSPFPWDIFMGVNDNNLVFFNSSTLNNINSLEVEVSNNTQIIYHNLLNTNLISMYTYIDASCYNTEENFIYISSFSCLYTNTRVNFFLKHNLEQYPTIFSSTSIFLSSQWVERELREFFNLFIINLNDTRRLLTDYMSFNISLVNYKTTSYDLITQDLYSINRGATLSLFFYVFIFMCNWKYYII